MSSVEVAPDALEDLQATLKSRTFYKAAGLSLQFVEAYVLQRGLRSLVQREVGRFFEKSAPDKPPDVHPDILERLLLIRNQAVPVVNKLRRYTATALGPSSVPELHEMSMAVLLATPEGRDLVVRWLEQPDRFEAEAHAELKRIAQIVERHQAAPAAPPPLPALPPEAPKVEAPPPAPAPAPVVATPAPPPPVDVPPEVPDGFKATAQRGQVTLVWSPAKGARSYTVQRSADPAGPFESVVAGHGGTEYVDRSVSPGKTYYYCVLSAADGRQSAACSSFPVEVPALPGVPTALEARVVEGRVDLKWIPAKDALRYRIKRSVSSGGYTTVAECADPTYWDGGVEAGKTYGYTVSALNDAGEGPDSDVVRVEIFAPPAVPTGLAVQALNGYVTLTWEAVPGAARYVIKRALQTDAKPVAVASGIETLTYTDSSVTNGTTYYYRISALNPGGESADSAPVEATPIEPPRPPTGVTAVQARSSVLLKWTPAWHATSYTVKRSTAKGGPYASVASKLTQPSYKDDHVTAGSSYFYVVHSVHARLGGPRSAEVSIQVVSPPTPPTDLVVESKGGVLVLTWTPTPGATSYKVRRSESGNAVIRTLSDTFEARYEDRSVAPMTDYQYRITALNAAGESGDCAAVAGSLETIPDALHDLKAQAGNGQVTLHWVAAKGATSYAVQRAPEAGGSFVTVATIGPSTNYTDSNVPNGAAVVYRLLPINDSGEGPASSIVRAVPMGPPPPPTGLEVSTGDGRVVLTWTAAKGAASYAVKRSTGEGPLAAIGTTSERTYADGSVTNGTSYRYVVVAISGGGESAESAAVTATPVDPPSAPVGLSAKPGNRRVSIGWFATPGATSYSIKRATSPDGPYITVGKPTEPSFDDTSVENRTKYFYVVNAHNPAGRSPNSEHIDVTPAE